MPFGQCFGMASGIDIVSFWYFVKLVKCFVVNNARIIMKKLLLNVCMLLVTLVKVAAVESRSVYELCPKDPEAVYFTPDNYAIKADGSMDVSDALQNAINEVKKKYNFGIVFLPEGKYKITKTIYIPKAVRLIGYGKKRPIIFLAKRSH